MVTWHVQGHLLPPVLRGRGGPGPEHGAGRGRAARPPHGAGRGPPQRQQGQEEEAGHGADRAARHPRRGHRHVPSSASSTPGSIPARCGVQEQRCLCLT